MNGRKVRDVFVSCKCFSNFSEKPWLKLFEGHEMAFFCAAKVLLSLYEKKKKVFCPKLFFYTCEMVLPFWTFFASSNESVSCLAMCWVVHSGKSEEMLFMNYWVFTVRRNLPKLFQESSLLNSSILKISIWHICLKVALCQKVLEDFPIDQKMCRKLTWNYKSCSWQW